MKATKLLKNQHQEVRGLFQRLEKAEETEQAELFEELAAKLVAHDAIEREIFYPACEEQLGQTDLLGESLVEHGLVEFGVYQADLALGSEDFKYKCTVLKETFEHHVKEEEKELFSQVEKAFEAERLDELGEELETRFEQAMAEDFREALRNNLEQVLAGATKTQPASAKSKARPAHKGDGRQAQPRSR